MRQKSRASGRTCALLTVRKRSRSRPLLSKTNKLKSFKVVLLEWNQCEGFMATLSSLLAAQLWGQCCTSGAFPQDFRVSSLAQHDTTNMCSYQSGQLLSTLSRPSCSAAITREITTTHFRGRVALFSLPFPSPWESLKTCYLPQCERGDATR